MFRISIHAPSWERQIKNQNIFYIGTFQSTLPCGSDVRSTCMSFWYWYFNPRSLTWATKVWICFCYIRLISIHAPSREWLDAVFDNYFAAIFQSTLPRGSDKARERHFCYQINFNPRSLAGATFTGKLTIRNKINFNPRSLAGATYH